MNFHTLEVLDAVELIGQAAPVAPMDLEILQLTALFHDTGYQLVYQGHEAESGRIATHYLIDQQADAHCITQVQRCIGDTHMPSNPNRSSKRACVMPT